MCVCVSVVRVCMRVFMPSHKHKKTRTRARAHTHTHTQVRVSELATDMRGMSRSLTRQRERDVELKTAMVRGACSWLLFVHTHAYTHTHKVFVARVRGSFAPGVTMVLELLHCA